MGRGYLTSPRIAPVGYPAPMLAGHYAPALLLKAANPRVPLWALFVGVQFVDILWAVFVTTGIERSQIEPGFTASNGLVLESVVLSHSLVAAGLWAGLVGLVGSALLPGRFAGPFLAAAVASHWLLDLPMHTPDLPLAGSHSLKLGLGLWNYRFASCALEVALLTIGFAAFLKRSRPLSGPKWAPATLGASLFVLAVAGYYGPQPPSIVPTALSGLFLYFTVPILARFADSQRTFDRSGPRVTADGAAT